jgi:Rieske Fe-S protein
MDPKDGSSTKPDRRSLGGGGPAWAEEFSVYAAEDAYVQRRQFTKFLVMTSAGMVAGNAWIWLKAVTAEERRAWPEAVVARASEFGPGTVRFFSYPGPHDPCILVRRTNGEFTAFSQKCTHLSCAVYYAAARDRLECPCHEGYFSASNGRVLQGPPPRPLPQIRLEQRGDDLVAVGMIHAEGE